MLPACSDEAAGQSVRLGEDSSVRRHDRVVSAQLWMVIFDRSAPLPSTNRAAIASPSATMAWRGRPESG
jgi:hypothetical protein